MYDLRLALQRNPQALAGEVQNKDREQLELNSNSQELGRQKAQQDLIPAKGQGARRYLDQDQVERAPGCAWGGFCRFSSHFDAHEASNVFWPHNATSRKQEGSRFKCGDESPTIPVMKNRGK